MSIATSTGTTFLLSSSLILFFFNMTDTAKPLLFGHIIGILDKLLELFPSLTFKKLVSCGHCHANFPSITPYL